MVIADLSQLIVPERVPFVIDHATISAFHQADAVERVLRCWPGEWIIPREVRAELELWPPVGSRLAAMLTNLCGIGLAAIAEVDPRNEGKIFRRLTHSLGRGEAAAIAIALHRKYRVVLFDPVARQACEYNAPSVPHFGPRDILKLAVAQDHLPDEVAHEILQVMGIER